jgi:peptidoglycan/LPS O-acetylase OafA/YrhL
LPNYSWGRYGNLVWNNTSWSIGTGMAAYLVFPVLILIKNALRIWSSIIFIGLGDLFTPFRNGDLET